MQVFKFGGASLKDSASIKQVANIIQAHRDEHLIIVVSAMGKTTNALELVFRHYIENNDKKYEALNEVKEYHLSILSELFEPEHEIFIEIEQLFIELHNIIAKPSSNNYDFEYDRIVSFGEIISSKIVYRYLKLSLLNIKLIDIRKCLITDSCFREANILFEKSTPRIKQNFSTEGLYICQGFIGGTENGESTTLGREGSDYTAAALAYMLDAKSLTIWKDVPGVLNADPRIMPDAVKLNRISYKEAIELAYYGAQVIHPKTIKPLQNKNIPLFVKPFMLCNSDGTMVMNIDEKIVLPPIYIYKYNQVLVSIMSKDFSFIVEENLSIIFKHLADIKIKVNLMQLSAVSFSICFDFDSRKLNTLLEALSKQFDVLYNTDLTLVTIRHYTDKSIVDILEGKNVILKEISRKTARIVYV